MGRLKTGAIIAGMGAGLVLFANVGHNSAEHQKQAGDSLSTWMKDRATVVTIGDIALGRCKPFKLPGNALSSDEVNAMTSGIDRSGPDAARLEVDKTNLVAMVDHRHIAGGVVHLAFGQEGVKVDPAPIDVSVCYTGGQGEDVNFTVMFPSTVPQGDLLLVQ